MNKPSLYIPIIDNGMGLCRAKWATSLFGAAMNGCFAGRQVTWVQISYPYPEGACNIVGNAFLGSGCDELFLMDIDIVFTPQDVNFLLSHEVPYVGGIVPKRKPGLELAIFNYEPLAENPFAEGVNPLVDASCGRGFVRIHRSVFESLIPHVPTYADDQENGEDAGGLRYEFFRSKPGGHSEDFSFCELYRNHGGKTYIDQRILTQHVGDATYPIAGTY